MVRLKTKILLLVIVGVLALSAAEAPVSFPALCLACAEETGETSSEIESLLEKETAEFPDNSESKIPETTKIPELMEMEKKSPAEIPDSAEKMITLQDVLNPSRSIDIWAVYDGNTMHDGMNITLVSVFHGYDNLEYSFHWEVNTGGGWQMIGNPNEERYRFRLTENLYHAAWRVVVYITGGETE